MRRDQRGWTLLELIVVMSILGSLVALSALAQSRLLPHYRLSAAARQVVTDLRLVRSKAVSQNDRFRMIFEAGSDSYRAERRNSASGLWEHYSLYRRGATTAAGEQPVSLPSGVTTAAAIEVTFDPRGTVEVTSGAQPIVLSVPGPRTRSVSINVAGLISIS